MTYDAYCFFDIEHIEYNSTMIWIINGIPTYSYVVCVHRIMNIKKFDMKIGASYLTTAYTTILLRIWTNYFYARVHIFNGNEFLFVLIFYEQAYR